jgi:hypothetical protein
MRMKMRMALLMLLPHPKAMLRGEAADKQQT